MSPKLNLKIKKKKFLKFLNSYKELLMLKQKYKACFYGKVRRKSLNPIRHAILEVVGVYILKIQVESSFRILNPFHFLFYDRSEAFRRR